MSYSQISLEKKKYDFKITAFAFSQASILFFGAALGFWIVAIIRRDEIDSDTTVKTFQTLAIVFTVLLVAALIVTLVTYLLYVKFRNLLDGFIDDSIVNIKKPASQPKQNININVNNPPRPAPAAPAGPIKRVTTTTTTTRPTPGIAPPVGPRPMGPAPRPVGSPVGPRPMGPSSPVKK